MNTHHRTMSPTGSPVVENTDLPSMDDAVSSIAASEGDDSPAQMLDQLPTMGDDVGPGHGRSMDDADAAFSMGGDAPGTFESIDDDLGPAYLRFVVSVDGDGMSISSATVVDGPLIADEPIGALMYQALIDGRPISAGGLPDLFEVRGLPHEDDPEAGHAFGRVDTGEFVVRTPRENVSLADLDRLEIELTRPMVPSLDVSPGTTLQDASAASGVGTPDTVGRIVGVDLASLPENDAAVLRRRLR